MGEDTKYVLRDIINIRQLPSTREYIIEYSDGRSDSTLSAVLFNKSKLPMLVLCEYKKICDSYRFVGLAEVKESDSKGQPTKFGSKLENKLSFGGRWISPEKSVKIQDARIR